MCVQCIRSGWLQRLFRIGSFLSWFRRFNLRFVAFLEHVVIGYAFSIAPCLHILFAVVWGYASDFFAIHYGDCIAGQNLVHAQHHITCCAKVYARKSG